MYLNEIPRTIENEAHPVLDFLVHGAEVFSGRWDEGWLRLRQKRSMILI